jgi:hypothetical protein
VAVTKRAIKGTAIESPRTDPRTHFPVLVQLKEVVEIGQRLRGDPNDSFVRVSELVSLGIARLVNGTLQPYATYIPLINSANVFLSPGTNVFTGPTRDGVYTVATLPAAGVSVAGDHAFVTDALAPVFGAAVAGGGAVKVPVYYTGAAWFVG